MKILFISSGSIGDAIIATGILAYLMDSYPEAEFTVAAGPAAAPLFKPCPRVARVIVVRKEPWNRHWLHLWQQTCDTKWDAVIDLRGSLLGYLLNAKKRFVFRRPDKSLSKAGQLAAMLDLPEPPPPRLWSSEESRTAARALLPQGKTVVVLAPRTNSEAKDWPLDRFAELARRLKRDNTVFAVLATPAQQPSLKSLFMGFPPDQMLDLSGKTDLLAAYAIIEQAKLFIGNDSGLLHMAAAAGTPAVGIYGPSNDKTYAPRGPKVRIVTAMDFKPGEEEKRDNRFMQMISVDKVEAAARDLGVL